MPKNEESGDAAHLDPVELDRLSRVLFEKMDDLDPTPEEITWEEMTEYDRDFYRTCVVSLLREL